MAEEGGPAVNALNANQKVLQCFWDLAGVEQEPRLKAVEQLVTEVRADQKTQAPVAGTAGYESDVPTNAPASRQLEHALRHCSPLMTYALRRLAKGVGSGRAASRQGYATALTLLLSTHTDNTDTHKQGSTTLLTTSEGIALLQGCLESMGRKGGDVRDALLGRLFGLASIVRAGIVRTPTDASTVLTALLGLANKKWFVREAVMTVVTELLLGSPAATGQTAGGAGGATANGVATDADTGAKKGSSKKRKNEDTAAHTANTDTPTHNTQTQTVTGGLPVETVRALLTPGGPDACEALQRFVSCKPGDATPEALLLALLLWPYMPEDLRAASPLPPNCPAPPAGWATQANNAHTQKQLAATANELYTDSYLKQVLPVLQATTSCSPRLHTLWPYLLALLVPGFKPHYKKVATDAYVAPRAASTGAQQIQPQLLGRFWTLVVEEGLLKSSNERKYLAMQLFLLMLPHLPASSVDTLFSRNFSHVLAHSATKPDTYLHAMAKKVLDRVQQFLTRSSDSAAKLRVSAALSRLGGVSFQKQASAKATSGLLAGMDQQGIQSFCEGYMQAFLRGTSELDTTDTHAKANGVAKKPNDNNDTPDNSDDDSPNKTNDATHNTNTHAVDTRRSLALEQLVMVLKFPSTTDETRSKVLRFLAACAFFSPADTTPASTTPAPDKSATKSKKNKTKTTAATTAEVPAEIAAQAAAAAAGAPPLSAAARQLCAQRLLTAVMSAPPPPAPAPAAAAGDATEGADGPAKKKAKKGADQGAHHDAHHFTPERDPARLSSPTLAYIRTLLTQATQHTQGGAEGVVSGLQLAGGPLTEDTDVAMSVLRELESALTTALSQPHSTRARAFLRLVQLLQLHVLGSPDTAPDTALLYDLRRVCQEALNLNLPALEEEAVGDGEGTASDEDQEDAPPAWSEVLLDLLLSLLSQPAHPLPSAPLRTACEAVWKQCCDTLTVNGMKDLMRVVSAPVRKSKGTGGDDSDMSDDEGDVLEADQDESDDESVQEEVGSDSDTDSESDKEGDQGADERTARIRAAMEASTRKADEQPSKRKRGDNNGSDSDGNSSETDGDSSDVDSDPADDEEMFKMDEKLSAYLKAVTDKRKSAKERAAAMQALQFRALTLLEMFAAKCLTSPLLLLTPLPLLRTLSVADRLGGPLSDPVLAQRLTAMLTKTLAKAKPAYDPDILPVADTNDTTTPDKESDSETAEETTNGTTGSPTGSGSLNAVLHRLLYLAGRSESKAMTAGAGAMLGVVLRSAGAASDTGVRKLAEDTYQSVLSDFLTKKSSRLSVGTVEAAGARGPMLGLASGPLTLLLAQAAGGARNVYKQVQALQVLASLLKSVVTSGPDALAPGASLAAALKRHAGGVGSAVEAAACGAGMKAQHHAEAVKAAVQVVEVIKRVASAGGNAKLATYLGSEHIHGTAKAVVTVRDLAVAPRVNTQLSRLCQVLGIEETVKNLGPDPALRSRLVAANAAPKQREAPAAGKESKDSTASEGGKKKVQAQPAQKKAKGGSADAQGKGKASASGKEGAAPPAKRHKGDKKKAGE